MNKIKILTLLIIITLCSGCSTVEQKYVRDYNKEQVSCHKENIRSLQKTKNFLELSRDPNLGDPHNKAIDRLLLEVNLSIDREVLLLINYLD